MAARHRRFRATAEDFFGNIEPANSLAMTHMDGGNVSVRMIEHTDVKSDQQEAPVRALPSQRGSTLTTEPAFHTRRGPVNLAVPLCERDPIRRERH